MASPLVVMGTPPLSPRCYHPRMFIVGIDVGGTFTDLTAVDEATGRVLVTADARPRRRRGRGNPNRSLRNAGR